MAIRHKATGMVYLKAQEDGEETPAGIFEGYASKFSNVDSQGEIVMPGAFTETLKSFGEGGAGIPCYWGHRMDDPEMCIGVTTAAVEDKEGLKVTVQLDLESPKGKKAYELIRNGIVREMSFGFSIEDWSMSETEKNAWGEPALEINQVKLFEVSLVQVGANSETEITDVKHAKPDVKELDENQAPAAPASTDDGGGAGLTLDEAALKKLQEALKTIQDVIDEASDGSDEEHEDTDKPQDSETGKGKDPAGAKSCTLSVAQIAEYKQFFTEKGTADEA